jgi:hypothetical protein
VLGGSLIFQRTASFGYLKKNQNQRTGRFWVFKNIRIKKTTSSRYFKPLKEPPVFMKEQLILSQFFDFKKEIPVWSQGQVSRFVFCQVDSGASVFTN